MKRELREWYRDQGYPGPFIYSDCSRPVNIRLIGHSPGKAAILAMEGHDDEDAA